MPSSNPYPPLPSALTSLQQKPHSQSTSTVYYLLNSTPSLRHRREQCDKQNSLDITHFLMNNWIADILFDCKKKLVGLSASRLECTHESTRQFCSHYAIWKSIKKSYHSAHGKNGSHLEPPMKMLRLSSWRAVDIFSMGKKEQVSLKENTLTAREQVASIVNALTTFLN